MRKGQQAVTADLETAAKKPRKLGDYEMSQAEEKAAEQWVARGLLRPPAPEVRISQAANGKAEVIHDHVSQAMWHMNFQNVFGTTSGQFADMLLGQLLNSIRLSNGESFDGPANGVIAAMHGIAPRDETEAMLAAQMVASHQAAMECYRRAMLKEQTFEGRQASLNHAGKLSRTHAQLLEALNRYRGKGQQKVTVEHVHVHQGGQAIVGSVHHEKGGSDENHKEQSHATGRPTE